MSGKSINMPSGSKAVEILRRLQHDGIRALTRILRCHRLENPTIPIADTSPLNVLRGLMDANNLRQKDLIPIFGSESIVSEVLHRKRELNKTHITKLSKRFHVSPAVFF